MTVKMRSALKLIAFSLLLTACSESVSEPVDQSELPNEVVPEQSEPVSLSMLQEQFGSVIDCDEVFEVTEGDFQTLVCEQGVIRFWESGLTDSALAPWLVWCEPALAAGGEPEFEVLFGEQFIIENHNDQTIGSTDAIDLCLDLAKREFAAFESSDETSYGLLTNLAQSGVCLMPPSISNTSPLRHICSGFGLGGEQYSIWLETGDVSSLVGQYAAECGEGIAGTYSTDWLMTTYDVSVEVSGFRLQELLGLVSPLPFSALCEGEESS